MSAEKGLPCKSTVPQQPNGHNLGDPLVTDDQGGTQPAVNTMILIDMRYYRQPQTEDPTAMLERYADPDVEQSLARSTESLKRVRQEVRPDQRAHEGNNSHSAPNLGTAAG